MSYEINQLLIAESFQTLHLGTNGRPTLPHAELHARHELCEDLAQSLCEVCLALKGADDTDLSSAIRHCHDGLAGPDSGISRLEAGWVANRLAELLQHDAPDFLKAEA